MGEGSDVAGAAIFLSSPAAAWISGAASRRGREGTRRTTFCPLNYLP